MIEHKMDELTEYLRCNYYREFELEQILNKKIIITKEHIENIDVKYNCCINFNIIKLFEKYGYCFTNDDYILFVSENGAIIQYISEDNKTNEICKIAVQQNKQALQFVPDNKKYLFIKNENYNI